MNPIRNIVYIETTIPSFYHTLRSDPESIARRNWTREWWDVHAAHCQLTTSAAVIAELMRGTGTLTQTRIQLLDGVMLLPITQEVKLIAEVYIERFVMPRDPEGDALHLAVASYYKVDYLLTWNCRHLANSSKFGQIRAINFQLGLSTPELVTPLNFGSEMEQNHE